MAEAETPAPTGETNTEVTSNNAGVPAQGAGTGSTAEELAARLEAAEKARQQAEMRARQLENERKEAERKTQEEQGEYKSLYEKTQAELAEIRQQKEMDELMSQYPPEVQSVAKKLFTAGDLPTQMAALSEAVKQVNEKKNEAPAAEDNQPPVVPMNPNPNGAEFSSILKPEMTLEQQAEALDKKLKGLGL